MELFLYRHQCIVKKLSNSGVKYSKSNALMIYDILGKSHSNGSTGNPKYLLRSLFQN
uniref:Ovule protein n=1 Tax=Heterorhabditis bacteriophora TaxID=37862 RepID=A0A1I7WI92_HETBA